MVIMLWALGGPATNPHRLENHVENQVVYTSTHDMDTLAGARPGENTWRIVEQALSSKASLAIVPVQDVLGLGSEARMNHPGEIGPHNWTWRLEPGQLTLADALRLRIAAEAAARA
jgi:4-alpha-glucanotransferase